jgi:ATP-binding cassette subfamily B protein
LTKKYIEVQEWFSEKIIKIYRRWSLLARSAGTLSDLGVYTGYVLVFNRLISGLTSVGSMFFQIRMVQSTQSYLSDLTSQINNVMEFSIRIQEVYDIFQMKEAHLDGTTYLPRLSSGPEIKIENISFSYPNNEKKVLEDLSLLIKPGEKIAIVGENGSGKTTLVKLICRMYSPTKSTIKINDLPLEELRLDDWYKNLSVMFQEYNTYPQLTVKENIIIGRTKGKYAENTSEDVDIKEAKMQEAAENSNIMENIYQFPNGWDQLLSEKYKGGLRPSTGQWQKIAIARFFYRDTPMVIFDEPTSSIDAISEYNIFNKIYEFFRDKTVVIISHRFSTVRNADRIIVLKDGRIEEQGNHDELMGIQDGIYKTSFEIQKLGYN